MTAEATAQLWKAGRLRYKLHGGQRKAYDKYRRWEKDTTAARKRLEKVEGLWPRVFILNCSRRFGKDFLCILMRIEDCLNNPKSLYSYGTAFQKDIASIVIPIMETIMEDCPEHMKPVYRQSFQGVESGYYFRNGSVLRLIGLESNPDGLRGRFSHGMTISEACYVKNLKHVITSIIMPQFMTFLQATLILNSTPSAEPSHPYKIDFIPDAITRDAYLKFTIFDNPRVSEAERDEYIQQLGGVEHEECRRELFCEDVRSETRTVIPEFSQARHVIDNPQPDFAVGYTVVDPGVRDLCAVVSAYYDFERGKLVIVSDWAARNTPTNKVAQAIRDCETQAFTGLNFWKDKAFASNPSQRFSDTDARMILDLNVQHGIRIGAADKDGKEAALNSLRNAFAQDRIEVRSTALNTIQHLEGAVWNKSRSDYERSDALGHCDLLDAVKYLWRHVNQHTNPNPPYGVLLQRSGTALADMQYRAEYLKSDNSLLKKAQSLLPLGRFRSRRK